NFIALTIDSLFQIRCYLNRAYSIRERHHNVFYLFTTLSENILQHRISLMSYSLQLTMIKIINLRENIVRQIICVAFSELLFCQFRINRENTNYFHLEAFIVPLFLVFGDNIFNNIKKGVIQIYV